MARVCVSICVLIAVCGAVCLADENQAPVVSNVRAAQRGDCSNMVDIYYDLADAEGDECYIVVRASADGGATWDLPVAHVSGNVSLLNHDTRQPTSVAPGTDRHIEYELARDVYGFVCNDVKVRVIAEDVSSVTVADLCFVPAGRFMTSTSVSVSLSAYWIDKYEVTNALYCDFLNDGNAAHYHTEMAGDIIEMYAGPIYGPIEGRESYPVRYVTWFDAVAFCDWRSQREGLPAGSYHLPTEAQWEKAAGWDPVLEKLWTYAIQSDSIDCGKVNYGNCVGGPTEVGTYAGYTSYYGCYDMSGNVWEWCGDWYGGTYPSSGSDPGGPTSGSSRVVRGGVWYPNATYVQVACRSYRSPSSVYDAGGFRCARTIE